MEGRLTLCLLLTGAWNSMAASVETPNFIVEAPTDEFAKRVAAAAEHYRREIALAWLEKELPTWYSPCKVVVRVGRMGAGGSTSFSFKRGHVFGWRMRIQGSEQRILDSVLPHEITHTILACQFRRPIPRWADEGAATLAETESEQRRQHLRVAQILRTRSRIKLRRLFALKEYPENDRDIMSLYAQGHSLVEMLVHEGGKARFLQFLEQGHRIGWDAAIRKQYGDRNLDALEKRWTEWFQNRTSPIMVVQGRPMADAVVIRSQSPSSARSRPKETRPASLAGRDRQAARDRRWMKTETGAPRWTPSKSNSDAASWNQNWTSIRRKPRSQNRWDESKEKLATTMR